MTARYAIYFAASGELAACGDRWLGRAVATDIPLDQPAVPGLTPDRLAALTHHPRLYGFHGTLKPPFALAPGRTADDLEAALAAFAARRATFMAPPLALRAVGRFLALTLSDASPAMQLLADDCVRDFDAFRAPAGAAELAKRRAAGLSARQEDLLQAWGYPYVMEEYRFHLTLTERLDDEERALIVPVLQALFDPLIGTPLPVTDVALYMQPATERPFRIVRRFAFGAAGR